MGWRGAPAGADRSALTQAASAGAQARHFWQQDAPPPSPMEQMKEQVQRYMESAKAAAREAVAQLDASHFGQHYE